LAAHSALRSTVFYGKRSAHPLWFTERRFESDDGNSHARFLQERRISSNGIRLLKSEPGHSRLLNPINASVALGLARYLSGDKISRFHSHRNAVIGSTAVARRAGTAAATIATTISNSATLTSVIGSLGFTP